MNSTVKHATVKRFYYEVRAHLTDFVTAYNFAKCPKTLKGFTPYEYICKPGGKSQERFTLAPFHQMPGPNI